jgi:hypothetical protein
VHSRFFSINFCVTTSRGGNIDKVIDFDLSVKVVPARVYQWLSNVGVNTVQWRYFIQVSVSSTKAGNY